MVGRLVTNERDSRRDDGGDQGRGDGGPVIMHRQRQLEGQHAEVMHRPDSGAHGDGAAGEPCDARPPGGHLYPAGEIERDVSCEDGDDDRQDDESVVVRARPMAGVRGHRILVIGPRPDLRYYSALNAVNGSTRVAFRAGM